MKSIRRLVCAVLVLGLACLVAMGALCEPVTPDGQAAAQDAKPRVLLYIVNHQDMKQADAACRAANAYLLMLALLPTDTQLACATIGTDVGQPMQWLERADTAALQALAAKTVGDVVKTKNQPKAISDSMAAVLGAATQAPTGQPLTIVLLHAQRYGLDAQRAATLATAAAGQNVLFRLPTYAGKTFRDDKRVADIGAALSIPVLQAPPASGAQSAIYLLAPDAGGGYAQSALADVDAILTGRFGLATGEALIYPDTGGLTITPVNLPTTGVRDIRLLLLDVPTGDVLSLADAQGSAALTPDLTLEGSAAGLENRVYTLLAEQGKALASLRMTLPPAQEGDTAQQAAQPAPLADGLQARLYYRMAAPPDTSAYLLDSVQRKNSPFRVRIEFCDDEAKTVFLDNQAFQEAFIRIDDQTGAERANVPAHYEADSGLLVAEATLTQSGTYSVRSGVRNLLGTKSETLGSKAIAVTVQNATPVPEMPTLTIDLLADEPFAISQAQSRQDVDVHACFSDADNAADTLVYRITQALPENAAAIDPAAYFRTVTDQYSATIEAKTGNMAVLSVAKTLTAPLRADTFYLVAYDDEQALGALPVTVRLHSVRLALQSLALANLAHAQGPDADDGTPREDVSVRLPTATLPAALQSIVYKHLKIYARIVPTDEPEAAVADLRQNGTELTDRDGDTWSGQLARPDANGEYCVEIGAELANPIGNAPFTADGWHLREAKATIAITNPTPDLLVEPRTAEQLLMPLEGMYQPQSITLDMAQLFRDRDGIFSLRYTARLVDETGAPCAYVALANPDGTHTWLLAGCTEAYIAQQVIRNGSARATVPLDADGITPLPITVGKQLTLEYGCIGTCRLEVKATNIDSSPAIYRLTLHTQDRVRLVLTLGLAGLATVLAVTLAALAIARKRIKPYANDLILALHDPSIGVRSVQISLPRWKKRKIGLGELLLNAAMPCLPWLDPLERYVYIRPTRRGAQLILRRRGQELATLLGEPEDTERKVLLAPGKVAEIVASGYHQGRLVFTLLAVPEGQPPTPAPGGGTGGEAQGAL